MTIILKDGQPIPKEARLTATALGNFDGVHRGHIYLLEQLRQQCPNRLLSVVTFEPHPRQLFRAEEEPFRLTTADERNAILNQLGVDYIFQINFTPQFAKLSAHDFIHKILHNSFGIVHIACGDGFAFGNHRHGNTEYLTTETQKLGIGLSIIHPLQDDKGIISSSRVRHLLRSGQPEKASELLGRVWSIQSIVQHGDKRGRTIGFPTANLSLGEHLEPKCGVYAIEAALSDGKRYQGVANLGYRPTIGHQPKSCLEVHLFDFDQEIYDQELTVWLHHFIRAEKRFSGLDALKAQIAKDAQDAKTFLKMIDL
ncbi:bifunctional riboflavin kinase/FAD synthetase [Commensalibacter oyaizuii]|uniref:Riboflavin biosynthesis protein n=1 Tax=Commensalibacter oyaizuii TaxID=3043873 RepID=A0ABT6Q0A5_9PROT|nr:bifunctional riboflavin kinase/FAD synthetase [Commensalibacter sp. TBRC 16381]MDI2090538.1 bifunctional riboflavin kinase/FAD synthetase [Commensalibacter sp. TBRC 16381]